MPPQQVRQLDDGSRRVVEISEVQRMEGEVITLQKLFEFKVDHFDEERRIVGRLHPTGLRPGFLSKFERHGIELPLSARLGQYIPEDVASGGTTPVDHDGLATATVGGGAIDALSRP